MAYENRRWLVIPTSIIDDINFDQVHEKNADSLRKSLDNSKTFIKYEVYVVDKTYTETFLNVDGGDEVSNTVKAGVYGRPSVYSTDYTEYNHDDILELLATEAWTKPMKE